MRETASTNFYQLKITLLGSDPAIWRRVLVKGDVTLHRLHGILNRAMGWENCHLYQFVVGRTMFSVPEPDLMEDMENAQKVHLDDLDIGPRRKFLYRYDFGDGWEHEVLVEKVLTTVEGQKVPSCIEGARACPPEDCGGIGGYYDILEAIASPQHSNHEEMKEWVGDDFDPEHFDLARTNARLK